MDTTGKILATCVIVRDEIIRHVQDALWLKGKSAAFKSENPDKQDTYLMDAFKKTYEGDGNFELCNRMMRLAFTEIAHKLKEWTDNSISSQVAYNDQLQDREVHSVEFYTDEEWSISDVDLLTQYMHYYIVYAIIVEWCSLVAPEYLELFAAQKAYYEEKIKSLLVYTGTPERVPFPWPLG